MNFASAEKQMLTWRSLVGVPADLGATVVTIGNFDGFHVGHQDLIVRARRIAEDIPGSKVVVVTFDPHPMAVLRPQQSPPNLTSIAQRASLLEGAGVDCMLIIPFTRELATWPPERFVEEIVVNTLHARGVVVGASFRFGHIEAGDVTLLRGLGERFGFAVEGIPLSGGPQVWSSTYVTNCVLEGDVAGAAEALGRPYAVRGVVIQGDQRGRKLGYPTANVPVRDQVAPDDGVYAGWLSILGTSESFPAAISVGTNPTFAGERDRRVEAHVLDRVDLDLYALEVEVAFAARIRSQRRFPVLADLIAAIEDDLKQTRRLLNIGANSE